MHLLIFINCTLYVHICNVCFTTSCLLVKKLSKIKGFWTTELLLQSPQMHSTVNETKWTKLYIISHLCHLTNIILLLVCSFKKKRKSWEMMASYLLCNELINAMHYQYAYNPYRQNHNLIHFDAHKSGDKTY